MSQLKLDNNFMRFFDDKTFPHKVEVCIGEERLICSGVLLAQHSLVFEKEFREENGFLMLDEIINIGTHEKQIECLKYLHGSDVNITLNNIETILKFSSWYEIENLLTMAIKWVQRSINCRYLPFFYKISGQLNSSHSTRLVSVCQSFIANNVNKVGKAIEELLIQDTAVDIGLLTILLSFYPHNGSIILREWTAKSLQNKELVLHNGMGLNLNRIFPSLEDFTSFINFLSVGSTSVETMKLVMEMQQSYFMGGATMCTMPDNEETPANVSAEEVSEDFLETSSQFSNTPSAGSSRFSNRKPLPQNKATPWKPLKLRFPHQSNPRNKYYKGVFNKPASSMDHHCDPSYRLYIGNIPDNTEAVEIRQLFSEFGEDMITRVDVVNHKKCAFIAFKSEHPVNEVLSSTAAGKVYLLKGMRLNINKYR